MGTIGLSSFYFGYTIIYLSVLDFGAVMRIFAIEMEEADAEGLLTFCVQLGGLFGSALSGCFIRRLSRMYRRFQAGTASSWSATRQWPWGLPVSSPTSKSTC